MFYLIGIVVTFFLTTILIAKKGKTEADWILVLWLGFMGVHLTFFYLIITGEILALPYLLGLEAPLPFLHGPFLYLYTAAATNDTASRKLRLAHFVPFFLTYVFIFPFFWLPSEQKIFVYENKGIGYETFTKIKYAAICLSGIVYVALSLRLLAKHERAIRNQFSFAEKINLAWLRYLIYGLGAVWIVVLLGHDPAIYSAVVVFVILLGYFGINQVGIFTQKIPPVPSNENRIQEVDSVGAPLADEPRKTKYLKSSLNEASAESIHKLLSLAMQEQKLFTNPELTLDELAQLLDVHRNNLSQVINTYEQKTFYDYINLKRVEEFKRVVFLPENQKFSLLGLAQNCGFNSKTSFNRNFKNATGLSPTEFLKTANILLEQ